MRISSDIAIFRYLFLTIFFARHLRSTGFMLNLYQIEFNGLKYISLKD